jgi:hypothetical protein
MLPFELLRCTSRLKQVTLECMHQWYSDWGCTASSVMAWRPRSLPAQERKYLRHTLAGTIYKCLSVIVTDSLYRLAERYGKDSASCILLSGRCRVYTVHEAAERREQLFCVYLTFGTRSTPLNTKHYGGGSRS